MTSKRIFVFDSNTAGHHATGAARRAVLSFGARPGIGRGRCGSSYAIPVADYYGRPLPLLIVEGHVNMFISYAAVHPELTFFVASIACGWGGYEPSQIKPFFKDPPINVELPPELRPL